MNYYPDVFFDFSEGVDISEEKIRNWLMEVKEELEANNKERDFTYIKSGNTVVIGFKEDDQYEFVVCKDYKEHKLTERELEKIYF